MEMIVVEIIGMVLVPIVIALMGYFVKGLNDKMKTDKENIDKDIDELNTTVKSTLQKDDYLREVTRIDKDITNLKNDINKNFDILRAQMQTDKNEVLAAIKEYNK